MESRHIEEREGTERTLQHILHTLYISAQEYCTATVQCPVLSSFLFLAKTFAFLCPCDVNGVSVVPPGVTTLLLRGGVGEAKLKVKGSTGGGSPHKTKKGVQGLGSHFHRWPYNHL